jgi:hypothetical protein
VTPATPWTELTAPETPYLKGIPTALPSEQLFGVFLMTDTGLSEPAPVAYTEMSIPATAHTEMTVAPTTWTELVL